MKPRIHVITLAVSDLERALEFYRALGLDSSGVIGTEFTGDDTNAAERLRNESKCRAVPEPLRAACRVVALTARLRSGSSLER